MEQQPIPTIRPVYFRLMPNGFGAWAVEVFDKDLKAIGLATYNRQTIYYQSVGDANKAAKARGLEPMPRRN